MKGDALTYRLLDELELVCAEGATNVPNLEIEVQALGPLIQLQRSVVRESISSCSRIAYGGMEDAAEFIRSPNGIYLNSTKSIGIAATNENDTSTELMQRALFALRRTNFPKDSAAQAVSALGELESNIHEHSEDPRLGIIAFEVRERFVGIYASDQGIGIINSLKRNPTFADLDDSGEALQLAVQEGVSSSAQRGRGMGFRPIFVGLASLCALLRFRSGDSLLEINGFGDGPPRQELRERVQVPGFHAFVHCTFGY